MFPASLLFSVLSTHGSQALSAWEPSLPACPLPPAPDPAHPRGPDARLLSQAVLQVLSPEDAAPEVPARAFRVVCDSMLGGLGRTLRCLGVDVRVLHSGEDHRQAAEVSGRGPPASLRGPGGGGGGCSWRQQRPSYVTPHPEVGQGSPGCRVGDVCSCPAPVVCRLLCRVGLVRADPGCSRPRKRRSVPLGPFSPRSWCSHPGKGRGGNTSPRALPNTSRGLRIQE